MTTHGLSAMGPPGVPNLVRDDARIRAALLHVESYDVAVDLTDGSGGPSERTFASSTTIRFTANRSGASTFAVIPGIWQRGAGERARNIVTKLFPHWASAIGPDTLTAADTFLAEDQWPYPLRRLVIEGCADIARALRARAKDADAAKPDQYTNGRDSR